MSSDVRKKIIDLITEACQSGARLQPACDIIGISIRSLERWKQENGLLDKRQQTVHQPANRFTAEERALILTTVNSPDYRDMPPCKIVPHLADEGHYIGSESTFYRILRSENQLSHRQLSKPAKHHKPQAFTASSANQVWSWDISYLPSCVLGLYFYLYMIIDIYSRKIVGWSIHEQELSEHAAKLIKQACLDEGVSEDQLVLHSDNGSPMKGVTMLVMLEKLGVLPSFSRPSVSDDNPYSESLFRTLKYHATFPMFDKFALILDARVWCEKFVNWYNYQHLHSALKFVTPAQRHSGEDKFIRQNGKEVYLAAKNKHPERWSGDIRNWSIPDSVSLNPDKKLDQKNQKNQVELKVSV